MSFEIADADVSGPTSNAYCVGMKFHGGDPSDKSNWTLDHINYWDWDHHPDSDHSDPDMPITVDQAAFFAFLRRHRTRLSDVLSQFISKLPPL